MTKTPSIFSDGVYPDGPVLPLYDDESRNDTYDDERPDEDGFTGPALDFKGPV